MNVGIICEFDPLHRGHAHLLGQARAMGASAVVCAMSGSFTQRGSFAAVSDAGHQPHTGRVWARYASESDLIHSFGFDPR